MFGSISQTPLHFADALRDVGQLFLVRPRPFTGKAFHPPGDRCGQGSRSRCIVFLSIQAAERNPFVPHRKNQTYIQVLHPVHLSACQLLYAEFEHRAPADISGKCEIFLPASIGTSFTRCPRHRGGGYSLPCCHARNPGL